METLNLNAETITWAIVTTFSAKTYAFKKATRWGNSVVKNQTWNHFSNREKAEKFVNDLKSTGVKFTAIFISDAEFGKMVIKH